MDALLAAAVAAAGGREPRIVLLPTAAARQRPELAAATGERTFRAAASRAGLTVRVDTAWVTDRVTARQRASCDLLAAADLVHVPGGDPDLVPTVLRGTPAWAAVLRAHARGACIAGASAGAMALGERLWTSWGPIDGLALAPGIAVVPHFEPVRLRTWRAVVEAGGTSLAASLAWVGLDERTLLIGRPGDGAWRVAGVGQVHLVPRGANDAVLSAGHGAEVEVG
jgi:cyanophycinase-like exopeptidase